MEGIVERLCKNCAYWSGGGDYGDCRRNPPLVQNTKETDFFGIFPVVGSQQWCGEFTDKWQVRNTRIDP